QRRGDGHGPPNNDAVRNVFVRDLQMGTTTLVSRASGLAGAGADADSSGWISADGRFGALQSSADNLSPDDDDAFTPIFRPDLRGGPPHCSDVAQSVVRDGATVVALPCADDDGDALTRAIVGAPPHGVAGMVDRAAGTIAYTPDPGYAG